MNIFLIREKFIFTQLFVFLLALLYNLSSGENHENGFILIYSIWNTISYFWLFVKEMKYAPDFHPFQILALITAQFIGLNGINCYLDLEGGDVIYFGATILNNSLYLGVIYLSLQHIILFGIFFYLEARKNRSQMSSPKIADRIKTSSLNYKQDALKFYFFIWVLRAISLIIPLASISSILVNLSTNGYIVSLFLLTFAMIKQQDRSVKYLHWMIVVVEILMVLNHGMKEEIIRALVPYCIYLIIRYKGGHLQLKKRTILQVSAIAAFVVLFVFPYVSIFRSYSWRTGRSWNEISTKEALAEYDKYIHNEGIYANDDMDRSTGYLMSRAGSIGCNAFSINYAKQNGPSPQYMELCGAAIIPRVIWPNKPAVVIGGMAHELSLGEKNWSQTKDASEYNVSVSLGFIGSCYFSLGFMGALILVILHAFFLWHVWRFHRDRLESNIVSIWAFSSLIFVILKDFESYQDCGINFFIFNVLYMIVCTLILKGPKHLTKQ